MSMLGPREREVIEAGLHGLVEPVTIRYYTPDVPSAGTASERALLEAIARASDLVHLEVLAERWDAAREEAVGIARTPAIALSAPVDHGIRYYGAPDGYELETFLGVVRAVSTGTSGVTEASRTLVQQLRAPLHLEVLVAPT
jgi:hypothetical protein